MPTTPTAAETQAKAPEERWRGPDAGRSYAEERWSSPRRAARDPRLVARLLARHGARGERILDAPCGTGRLRATLERFAPIYVGLDVSRPMLARAKQDGARRLAAADILRLPLRDASFDVVVACRILHHLADDAAFEAVVRELVRVSAAVIVASFWDSASLPALGRRVRGHRRRGRAHGQRGGAHEAGGRVAHTKRRVRAAFAAAGAEVRAFEYSFRFLSQQTFVLATRA